MKIEVEFFSYLTDYSPTCESRINLSIDEGTTLKNLLARVGIPKGVEKICFINGTYYPGEKVLQPGDVVSIYPMVDGG